MHADFAMNLAVSVKLFVPILCLAPLHVCKLLASSLPPPDKFGNDEF